MCNFSEDSEIIPYSLTVIRQPFFPFKTVPLTGLPWSGKNIWKMKIFPGQEKVREFCGWPGKFIRDLESQGI